METCRKKSFFLDCRGASIALAALSGALLTAPVRAGLLLTEIHYNGISAGSDPDEFVELSNSGSDPLDLFGYYFAAGIDYSFSSGTILASNRSLIIARDADKFALAYPDYEGALFDFAGALSNGGETLGLLDSVGDTLWSVRYDDTGLWPASADGSGDSLQLLADATDLSSPASWYAAIPTPGQWDGFDTNHPDDDSAPSTVSQPGSALLLLAALPVIWGYRRKNGYGESRG